MSYYAPYIDKTGIHVPGYNDVLEHLIDGYKTIFGEDMYLGTDTHDYQMLSLYALCWSDLCDLIVDAYNSRNPDWASGATLDALCALNGISRISATPSTVSLELTGTAGATLESGQLVRDSAGYQWMINNPVTFGGNGKATANAICTINGSITAEPNTITIIVNPSYDWSSVTNPSAAIVGNNDEGDADLRNRRRASVSAPSIGTIDSVISSLDSLGFESVAVYENSTGSYDSSTSTDSHAIHAVVYPGANSVDIAERIYLKKAPGIATSGSSTGQYVDRYGNTNTVKYSVATATNVSVKVGISKKAGWSSESESNLTARIIGAVNSLEIGDDLQSAELYGPCYNSSTASSEFVINSISINNGSSVSCGATQILRTSKSFITYQIA